MRNMLTALLVAHGVPMLLMGDEYGHRCAHLWAVWSRQEARVCGVPGRSPLWPYAPFPCRLLSYRPSPAARLATHPLPP